MLMIRLARHGKKKRPFYRIIISEKTKDTSADALEILGTVDPLSKPKNIILNAERITHWLQHGAVASPTVHNLLVDRGLVTATKIKHMAKTKKEKQK